MCCSLQQKRRIDCFFKTRHKLSLGYAAWFTKKLATASKINMINFNHISINETSLFLHFNNTIFDFSFFSSTDTVISSTVALVLLLNHPQNRTFLVFTCCTTFQQYDGTAIFPIFLLPKYPPQMIYKLSVCDHLRTRVSFVFHTPRLRFAVCGRQS